MADSMDLNKSMNVIADADAARQKMDNKAGITSPGKEVTAESAHPINRSNELSAQEKSIQDAMNRIKNRG